MYRPLKLFLLFFLVVTPTSVHAITEMMFDGPGVTHIQVDEYSQRNYSDLPTEDHCSSFLVYLVDMTDDSETLLAEGSESGGKLHVQLVERRTDLTPGHYTFRKKESFWEIGINGLQVQEESLDFNPFTLQLDRYTDDPIVALYGTLLYSEDFTLNEPTREGSNISVTVGDNLDFTLSNAGEANIGVSAGQNATVLISDSSGSLILSGEGSAVIIDCEFLQQSDEGEGGISSSINELTITSCGTDALSVQNAEQVTITDSLVRGGAGIESIVNFTISNSEFHGILDITAEGGSLTGSTVYNYMFIESQNPSFSPTISGNAFLASTFDDSTDHGTVLGGIGSSFALDLAGNYWADENGVFQISYPPIANSLTDCPGYNPSSIQAPRPLHDVSISYSLGQGVFYSGLSPLQGRDTLLTIGTETPYPNHLSGVNITLTVGQENTPVNALNASSHKIRDPHPPIPNSTDNADRTLNFIIPSDLTMVDVLPYTITVDTTGVTGYSTPGRIYTQSGTIPFINPYGRKLRIGVMPVHIDIDGYLPKPARNAVDNTVELLRQRLPALWPIAAQDIVVETLSPYQYNGGMLPYLAQAHGYGLMNDLSNALRIFRNIYNEAAPEPLDFIVAVLPVNALAGADGANLKLRRNIAMIDETSPNAAIHELGHGLGLYTGTEQYDLTPGSSVNGYIVADKGMVLQNTTVFNPGNTSVPQNPYRIRHFGGLTSYGVYDFMGNDKNFLATPNSYRLVGESLRTLLGTAGDVQTLEASPTAALLDTGVDYRLILHGALARLPDDSLQIVPESISTQDGESYGIGIEPTIELGYQLQPYDADGLPLGLPLACRHDLESTDPAGYWLQSFVLPLETSRIEISNTVDGVIWSMQKVGPATVVLNQVPVSLTGDVTFSWTVAEGADSTGTGRSELYMQSSAGAPFLPMGNNPTEQSYTVSAEDLPVSDALAFRLMYSEGFGNAVSQLSEGHNRAALPPSVTIISPVDQDAADPDTLWMLTASASADALRSADNQGGSLDLTYAWHSSLDNALGNTATLNDVQFSPGLHVITCTVTDSEGLQGVDQVEVNVAPQTTVDLHISEDALDVRTDGLDLIFGGGAFVQNATSSLNLTVRNGGLPGNATVTVVLTPPNGIPVSLIDESFDWDPLQSRTLVTSYVPQATGTHIVTATISMVDENGLDLESSPVDNTRTWAFANQAPQAHARQILLHPGESINLTLDASDQDSTNLVYTVYEQPGLGVLSGIPPELTYTAPNSPGSDSFSFYAQDNQPLTSNIATVSITIAEPLEYAIQHTISITTTPGGSANPTGEVTVDEGGGLSIEFTADPGFLREYIEVNGQYWGSYSPLELFDIQQDMTVHVVFVEDQDQDGMPDYWEIDYFGNISPAPTGDFDEDGLDNMTEYWFGINPADPDTDGDGMPDGWERDNFTMINVPDADGDADGDGIDNLTEYLMSIKGDSTFWLLMLPAILSGQQ